MKAVWQIGYGAEDDERSWGWGGEIEILLGNSGAQRWGSSILREV